MQSGIYEGKVRHRRFTPVPHDFQYRLCLLYLDLSELTEVFRGSWLWSASRPAPVRFKRSDHLGDPTIPLDIAVRDLVESKLGRRPQGPVRLLTNLRYYGFVMNPVSFYYCFDETDKHVECVVAEVTNTPWGEQHCYVIPSDGKTEVMQYTNPKEFHVSPFMDMKIQYRWRLGTPGQQLHVYIANDQLGVKLFEANLALHRQEISSARLVWTLIRYPFMSGKIVAGIYWQALKLWLKKCPVYSHPKNLSVEEVLPHECSERV